MMPDFTRVTQKTARKSSSCRWCLGTIFTGQAYANCAWTIDNDFDYGRYHLGCLQNLMPSMYAKMKIPAFVPDAEGGTPNEI